MRLCPSVEGSASPLITHRIGAEVCMARQSACFHKCHRCIYRGKAATWEPEAAPLPMLNVHAAEEPARADVKEVQLPGAAPVKKPAAAKQKPAGKNKSRAREKAPAAVRAATKAIEASSILG